MDYPTKEKFLASIQSDMKLDKAFFLKIYGYEISYKGFSEIAIKTLECAGCSKAQDYYDLIVAEYDKKQKESQKTVAQWLSKKIDADYEIQCNLANEGSEDVRQELLKQKKMLLTQLKEQLQA